MKNWIIALIALVSISAVAQERRHGRKMKEMQNMTVEEHAELQTKKLTLALVLDKKQQEDLYDLNLKRAKEMKSKMEARKEARENEKRPSADERKAFRIAQLDAKIAYQENIKSILNDEQFAQWRKMQLHKGKDIKGRKDALDRKDKRRK